MRDNVILLKVVDGKMSVIGAGDANVEVLFLTETSGQDRRDAGRVGVQKVSKDELTRMMDPAFWGEKAEN